MKKITTLALSIAMTLFAVASSATEDPVGEWRGAGRRGEFTIVISKDASGTLAGQMTTIRGSNNLSNVKLEGDRLSFTNLLEFNGQSFELRFAGKISGNTFTGTLSTPRGASGRAVFRYRDPAAG